MASDIAALEARLLASWSLDAVAAYGEALRAKGDPRGELIALDLVLERETNPDVRAALEESKAELQIEWYGDDEMGKYAKTKFGFVESLAIDARNIATIVDDVLPYVRRLELWGDAARVVPVLEALLLRVRPWLSTLDVSCYGDNRTIVIDSAIAARLEPVTPNLRTLEVRGQMITGAFPHAGIRHVIVDGYDAIGPLRGEGTMPNVTTLDLALHADYPLEREPSPEALRGGLVTPAAFPRLSLLDLGRNEPRTRPILPNCLGGNTPIFDVLPRVGVLPQLETLRIPSLRDRDQLARVQRTIAGMPALRALEIARMYDDEPGSLHHPSARITFAPRVSWPAGDRIPEYDALVFDVGGEWHRTDLDDAYTILETNHAQMTPEQLRAWGEIWDLARRLTDPATSERIPVSLLATLFATFEKEDYYNWGLLRQKLEGFADATIAVRHINGYEEKARETPIVPDRPAITNERILEHEAALQAEWDRDRLAVYADDLQQLGDARGELIAIDLAQPVEAERPYRRGELHDEVFGEDYAITSELGFAKVSASCWSEQRLSQLLTGDVARYLGEARVAGPCESVEPELALLFGERRPWLRKLVVELYGDRGTTTSDPATLVAMLPLLEELDLRSDGEVPQLEGFAHPRVHRMRITGAHGFAGFGAPWPALVELDFAFGARGRPVARAEHVLAAKMLPALRVLDLSRNEPAVTDGHENDRHYCNIDFYAFLGALDPELLANLRSLRLPSPRSPAHVQTIQRVLDRMPRLETFEIVRRYPDGPAVALAHPTATLAVPAPAIWPPADQLVDVELGIDNVTLELTSAALAMDRHFHTFPGAAQRAWEQLWRAVATRARFEFPAATLYAALEALKRSDDYTFDSLTDDAMALLHAPAIADKTITIERIRDAYEDEDEDEDEDDDEDAYEDNDEEDDDD